MIKFLNYVGLFALAALSVGQWSLNRALNHESARLESARKDLSVKLDERDQTVNAQAKDLNRLREHITQLTADLRGAESELAAAIQNGERLTLQNAELLENNKQWQEALGERDSRARELIVEYNELAANYKELSEALSERVAEYNKLLKRR